MTSHQHNSHKYPLWLLLGTAATFLPFSSIGMQTTATKAATASGITTAAQLPVDGSGFHFNGSQLTVSDNQWQLIQSNQYVYHLATATSNSGNSILLSDQSQYLVLYRVNEDLSGGKFTVSDHVAGTTTGENTYYSGNFQAITIDGATYYGFLIPSSVIRQMAQHTQNGHDAIINTTGGPSEALDFMTVDFGDYITGQASIKLPTVSAQNGTLASTAVVGKTVTVTDSATGNQIAQMTLTQDDVSVTNDDSTTGSYQYVLSASGKQKLAQQMANIQSQTGIKYTFDDSATGTVTIAAPAKLTGTINYVDDTGTTVKQQTVTANSDEPQSFSASAPAGYQLANGQANQISYTLTADESNIITIKVQKIPAAPITDTLKDIDDNGQASKTEAVTGQVGQPNPYKIELPAGYQLVVDQPAWIPNTFEDSSNDQKTVEPQKRPTSPITHKAAKPSQSKTAKQAISSVPPAVPAPTGTVNKLTSKVPAEHFGSSTIDYIDQATGRILKSEQFVGVIGQPIPFDTNVVVSQLMSQGYFVVSNGTLVQHTFQQGNLALTVSLKHFQPKTDVPTQDGTTTTKKEAATATTKRKSSAAKTARQRHAKYLVKSHTQQPVVVFGNQPQVVHSNGGNGNGDDSQSYLAQYFIVLSGKINLGTK